MEMLLVCIIIVCVRLLSISQWSWLKASLPSSRGGLNLRSTAIHAPAAFLGSSPRVCPLVDSPGPSPHIPPALLLLPTVLIGLISMMWMSLFISAHSPLPSTKLSTKAFSLSPSPLFKSSTCWGLAERGSLCSTWPSHP